MRDAVDARMATGQIVDLLLGELSLASIFSFGHGSCDLLWMMWLINRAHGESTMMGVYTGYFVQAL
ncbi:hypothetical protein [Yoonia sp. MH D7]